MPGTEFTTAKLSSYHKVPQIPEMKGVVLRNGIAIAWTKTVMAAELIASALNIGDNDD